MDAREAEEKLQVTRERARARARGREREKSERERKRERRKPVRTGRVTVEREREREREREANQSALAESPSMPVSALDFTLGLHGFRLVLEGFRRFARVSQGFRLVIGIEISFTVSWIIFTGASLVLPI